MTVTATTRLEAVNTMLSALGDAPVNSLTGSTSASVNMAGAILDEVSKEVQSEGWHFNTEKDVTLAPDIDGFIANPANAARIDVDNVNAPGTDIVVRDGKLYDKVAHTDVFTAPVKCEIVYLLEFTDLPEPARSYIVQRAARKFQDRVIGAQEHHSYNMRDEMQARARLREFDDDTADRTIFDNYDTFRIINRPYPRGGTA